jgi:hypothetical protein
MWHVLTMLCCCSSHHLSRRQAEADAVKAAADAQRLYDARRMNTVNTRLLYCLVLQASRGRCAQGSSSSTALLFTHWLCFHLMSCSAGKPRQCGRGSSSAGEEAA